jgi:hypothetical protein
MMIPAVPHQPPTARALECVEPRVIPGRRVRPGVHDNGQFFASVRQRGIERTEPRLCYMEWSRSDCDDPADPRSSAKSKPGMGYRISAETIEAEYHGRTITSQLPLGDGTQYVHCWHSELAHATNSPREIGRLTTRGGTRTRLIVSPPGHLDAVSEFPECESPSWGADW